MGRNSNATGLLQSWSINRYAAEPELNVVWVALAIRIINIPIPLYNSRTSSRTRSNYVKHSGPSFHDRKLRVPAYLLNSFQIAHSSWGCVALMGVYASPFIHYFLKQLHPTGGRLSLNQMEKWNEIQKCLGRLQLRSEWSTCRYHR